MRGARAVGSLTGAMLVTLALAAAPARAGPTTQVAARPLGSGGRAARAGTVQHVAGSCWQPPVVAPWQYQLQGSVNSAGQCLYPATGFINTAITGTCSRPGSRSRRQCSTSTSTRTASATRRTTTAC